MTTYDSLASLAAAMDRFEGEVRRQIAATVEVEKAAMTLTTVLPPERVDAALEEVTRREQVFATMNRETPSMVGNPRLAALQSVTDDVIRGRFA